MLLRLTALPPPLSPSAGGRAFSPPSSSSSQRAQQHSRGLLVASSSGGYRKVPLETEGAYRLIDDDTGDSVILWGDQHLPADHLLFPSSHSPPPSQTSSSSSFKSSFGKLKAHKVKALLDRRNTHSHQRQSSPHVADSQDDYRVRRKRHDDDDKGEEEAESGEEHPLARGGSTHIHTSTSSSMKRGWGADTRTNSFRPKQQQQRTRGSSVEIDRGFFSRKSFKDLGCTDYIIEALSNQLFLRPSHIQALSYAPILEGKSCIVADQSGSGKTLAYLTPVIQCLRQEELLGTAKSTPKNPRVVILVPTAELASQVLSNCRSLANQGVPFRSIVATGGFRQKTQLESLQQELDVLIATPGRFIYLLKEGYLELTNLKRASRGINFKAVDQVVLFDLPRDPSEYVRRVGRVARGAGGKGKAFVFAVGKQVSLARRIIERNLKGHPLHSVPC